MPRPCCCRPCWWRRALSLLTLRLYRPRTLSCTCLLTDGPITLTGDGREEDPYIVGL